MHTLRNWLIERDSGAHQAASNFGSDQAIGLAGSDPFFFLSVQTSGPSGYFEAMGKKSHGKLIELNGDARLSKYVRPKWENGPLRKGKVQWTAARPKPPPHLQSRGRPVFNDPNMLKAIRGRPRPVGYHQPPELSDELEACMYTGGCVVALRDLGLGERGVYPFPALELFYGQPGCLPAVPKGSLLMYAGLVRSTERMYVEGLGHKDVQVYKHTFITPHGHCIIHDFCLIGPA